MSSHNKSGKVELSLVFLLEEGKVSLEELSLLLKQSEERKEESDKEYYIRNSPCKFVRAKDGRLTWNQKKICYAYQASAIIFFWFRQNSSSQSQQTIQLRPSDLSPLRL
jgi:hypothetical protein